MIEVLTNNHFDKLLDLFDGTKKDIKIVSPFLTMSMAEKLRDIITENNISCIFITRFYLEDVIAKANSINSKWYHRLRSKKTSHKTLPF